MKRNIALIFICSLISTISSCNRDSPTEPLVPLPKIEDSTSYNMAYKDSIVALRTHDIVIMNKGGTGVRRLISIEGASSVTWSPKKWKILYSTPYELYVMNPDGTSQTKISREREYITYAICSPNGEKIAYVAHDSTLTSGWIKVMNVDGSSSKRITSLQPTPHRVSWNPDSRSVIFNGADSISTGIFIISIDGTNQRSLFYGTLTLAPSLSPDGSLLAFSPFIGMTNKLWLMNMSTHQLHQLTTGGSLDAGASWSPDGNKLVYARSDSTAPYTWIGPSVWAIDRDGNNNVQLTTISQDIYAPCWQN
ncbi:MAG: hypothetical protein QME52_07170 [Bacteroidota bacterium]|nr:hypothetical protein [Bacteroidota bacterium]